MAIAVQLPALSPTMKEGRITKWLKNEGDAVSAGTELAECETDKSNLAIEAYDDGVLLKILVKAGDTALVGSTIGWIGRKGEAIPEATPSASVAPAVPAPAVPAPAVPAPAVPAPAVPAPAVSVQAVSVQAVSVQAVPVQAVPVQAVPATSPAAPLKQPGPVARASASPAVATVTVSAPTLRLRASPLAKKIAAAQGVDLGAVQGSGPAGRIVRRDVEAALEHAPSPAFTPLTVERLPPTTTPLTQMRKVIAQRLGEVKPGVPHFYLTVELEMDQALALKDDAKTQDLKISVNDVLVKAVGVAVRRFPRINQVFAGDSIHQLHTVDVGVAVAIEDGLITPLVRDADQKGLAQISTEVRELAERARRKALKPEEYTGGSITLSNLGMFGIDSFIAVINPPQASILAVGKVEPRVVVREGQMVIRQMMSLTFSGDHRVVDGAVGAQFLQVLRELIEHPLRLLF